ncbi:methionyl-tRNA formyltransferase [Candidatus Gracilibacteria bacterium]|nr:MAG: methionyl-tRNA formyltransferase [Candidatus Gracilibacteria bacterium]
MKIGFLGTPELAKKVLLSLLQEEDMEVLFVITNPDKPVGRKKILTPTPVKTLAQEHDIDIFTPKNIKGNRELYQTIQKYECDYFVVVAYGKILPADFLEIPKKIAINVHGSILPKYRGASPIQSALLHGETETGVTIMQMSPGMDEGDILSIAPIKIDTKETTSTLFDKFGETSPKALIEAIRNFDTGKIQPIPQDDSKATYCTKITKQDGQIDWELDAKMIYHRWQAYTPWPGIYTFYDGKKLNLEVISFEIDGATDEEIGTVIKKNNLVGISCKQGIIYPEKVKLAGKKSQSIDEFVRGHRDFIGYKL